MKINNFLKSKISWINIVAGVIFLSGILRIFKIDEFTSRFDETTLLYFCAAGAVFLLKHAKTFKFGEFELELQHIKDEAKEAKIIAGIAEDTAKANSLSSLEDITEDQSKKLENIKPGEYEDDPWKGVFGGKNISKIKGRELTAEILPIKENSKGENSNWWYYVKLVVSTLPSHDLLEGNVQFFVHDTFKNNKPIIKVRNGSAILRLKAWGAFTVGALADNGETMLELDLAELSSAPLEFRSR